MYKNNLQFKAAFTDVVTAVTDKLKEQGFGVLTKIDVKAVFKEKLNIDRSPYLILGACNPQLAHRALELEPDIGLLLPCNVVVRQEKEYVVVSFMDPLTVLNIIENKEVLQVAKEAAERLQKVMTSLKEEKIAEH